MNVLGRPRVLWDHLRSALWVMPTLSVVIFLMAGAALSHVPIGDDSPLRWLVFQGPPEDARQMLNCGVITVTGLVFADDHRLANRLEPVFLTATAQFHA